MMVGGYNQENAADDEIQKIVDTVKSDIASKGSKDYPKLTAVSYKRQIVAGTNYHIKVDAGDEHLHVKVYQPLPHTGQGPQLTHVEFGKTRADQLI